MNIRRLVLLIAVVFLTGCSGVNENNNEVYTGFAEANQINLSAEIGGIIKEVFVEEGQIIKKGQPIGQIDTYDLELQLKQLNAELKIAEAQLREIEKGTRSEEIEIARANLDKAKIALDGARKDYNHKLEKLEDIKRIYSESGTSEQQVKDMEALVDKAYTQLKSAEKSYASADAQLKLLLNGATVEKIDIAKGKIDSINAKIELLKHQISKGKIVSPLDGVVQNVNYNEGELISIGGNISNIINPNDLWVKIYVPEKELHRVSLGDEVKLSCNFLKDESLKGEIIYISSEAEFTPKNVESKESKEEMVFEVKVKITDNNPSIKPGMLIDVILDGDK